MKSEFDGYAGRILEVDLTEGKTKQIPLEWDVASKYIGGKGFAARLLYDHLPQGCDPFDPENLLVFAAGPLTGTLVPGSGRCPLASAGYALHPSYRISLLQHWITALRLQSLPEKVLRVLYAVEPPSGSREADFWALIAKSDQRSATDYFSAFSRHRGEIIADTLRRLVREGTWRPAATDFPLRITPSQRLLLRVPNDLAQLAVHLDRHPEAFALASRGSPSLDDLVTLLQFECLIEISSTADTLFDASSLLGTTGGPDHRALVLSEDLSRELLALARAPQTGAGLHSLVWDVRPNGYVHGAPQ